MKKKTYLVVHETRNDDIVYHVRSDHKPSVEEVTKACEIDFDEDNEFLTIAEEHIEILCPKCKDNVFQILQVDGEIWYECVNCNHLFALAEE